MTDDAPPAAAALRGVARAKLNLGLRVVRRRDDGFHEIETAMALLDLHDDLEVARSTDADTLVRVASGDDALDRVPLPLDGGNLVVRAVAAYRSAAGARRPPPLRVTLRKRIPVAAGLGGGSSDAAAALRLLDAAWPAGVELAALAETLGSDVPFFVAGRVAARARGRGELLEPLELGAFDAVLVDPGVGVRAADAYGWWSAAGGATGGRSPSAPWRGLDLGNDLEPGVAGRVGAVAEVLAWLRATAPGPVAMSGSGGTCYALVEDASAAQALAARARRERAWWVRTVRSAA